LTRPNRDLPARGSIVAPPAAYGDFERESKIEDSVYKLVAALAEHEPVNGAREARPRVARKLAV
jgi:hypothetical protein